MLEMNHHNVPYFISSGWPPPPPSLPGSYSPTAPMHQPYTSQHSHYDYYHTQYGNQAEATGHDQSCKYLLFLPPYLYMNVLLLWHVLVVQKAVSTGVRDEPRIFACLNFQPHSGKHRLKTTESLPSIATPLHCSKRSRLQTRSMWLRRGSRAKVVVGHQTFLPIDKAKNSSQHMMARFLG